MRMEIERGPGIGGIPIPGPPKGIPCIPWGPPGRVMGPIFPNCPRIRFAFITTRKIGKKGMWLRFDMTAIFALI